MDPTYVIALEIGSSKIRGAAGTVDAQGILNVVALEEEPLVDCVRYGAIRNIEEVSRRISRIVRKIEDRLHQRKIKKVYVALGGLSYAAMPREVSRRLPEEGCFTEGLQADLRNEAFSLHVGDRDTVEVVDRRVIIDRAHMPQPVGVYGQDIKYECSLIVAPPRSRQMIRKVIEESLHLEIAGFVVRQLAEADLVVTNDERQLGVVLVDFGAETTGVSIYKHGYLIYYATLPLGSRNITIDIASLNFLESRAEELKKVGGNACTDRQPSVLSSLDDVNFDEINNYVQARSGEIIANINEQIKYSGMTPAQLPGGIVIVGGGAKLAGFNERLEQETKMKVRIGSPSAYVRITDGRIQGSEAVDAISVLYAASRRGAEECTELPPAPAPAVEPEPAQSSGHTSTAHQDDFVDDYLDDLEKRRGIRKEPKATKPGFWSRGRKIISSFLSDESEEDFDE